MDFNSQIEQISSDQLDTLFGDNPQNVITPKSDVLPADKDLNFNRQQNLSNDIPTIDLDKLDEFKEPTEEEKKIAEETKLKADEEAAEKAKLEGLSEEEKAAALKKIEEEKKAKEAEEEAKKNLPTEEETKQINTVLKSTVNYLVEKGLWSDFEGREELDIDEDLYAQISIKQNEVKLQDMFDELVDTTGPYGKAIIAHIKQGGNPDEVIDLFKEQKALDNIDITTDDGKSAMVKKYYSEVVGWNQTKIDKYVNGLITSDELESEAKEVKEKFDSLYIEQREQLLKEQVEQNKTKQKQQQEYVSSLSKTIDTYEGFTDKEKKLVKDSVLKFDKKLQDGTPVNDFYLKFYQIQNDPKAYIKLIHFVMDTEGYDNKVNTKQEAKIVNKTWNFVKGNNSVTKKTNSLPEVDAEKASKIDFSSILKK